MWILLVVSIWIDNAGVCRNSSFFVFFNNYHSALLTSTACRLGIDALWTISLKQWIFLIPMVVFFIFFVIWFIFSIFPYRIHQNFWVCLFLPSQFFWKYFSVYQISNFHRFFFFCKSDQVSKKGRWQWSRSSFCVQNVCRLEKDVMDIFAWLVLFCWFDYMAWFDFCVIGKTFPWNL